MHRTFQEASQEPLGQDYGAAEMEALRAAGRAGTTAIRRAKSNADPLVAQVRRDLAYAAGTVATLPAGEERDALAQAAADLRSQAERAAADAKLPLTAVRAGKVVRRQQGRPEGRQPMDRVVKALHPGRSGRKRQRQKSKGGEALEQSDEFQPRRKKGKPSHKVGAGCHAATQPHSTHCMHALSNLPLSLPTCRRAGPRCQTTRMAPSCGTALRTTAAPSASRRRRRRRRRQVQQVSVSSLHRAIISTYILGTFGAAALQHSTAPT